MLLWGPFFFFAEVLTELVTRFLCFSRESVTGKKYANMVYADKWPGTWENWHHQYMEVGWSFERFEARVKTGFLRGSFSSFVLFWGRLYKHHWLKGFSHDMMFKWETWTSRKPLVNDTALQARSEISRKKKNDTWKNTFAGGKTWYLEDTFLPFPLEWQVGYW